MKILFNPFSGQFETAPVIVVQTQVIVDGALAFNEGDLALDAGERMDEESIVDNGNRVNEVLV